MHVMDLGYAWTVKGNPLCNRRASGAGGTHESTPRSTELVVSSRSFTVFIPYHGTTTAPQCARDAARLRVRDGSIVPNQNAARALLLQAQRRCSLPIQPPIDAPASSWLQHPFGAQGWTTPASRKTCSTALEGVQARRSGCCVRRFARGVRACMRGLVGCSKTKTVPPAVAGPFNTLGRRQAAPCWRCKPCREIHAGSQARRRFLATPRHEQTQTNINAARSGSRTTLVCVRACVPVCVRACMHA